ncbi:MAG: hypothetical protein ACLFQV_07260, partial [Vulcanimicrobiota bacterium]
MSVKFKEKFKTVGTDVTKVDGYSLACGRAKFVDDFDLPGCLVMKIVPSPFAHARIKSIDRIKAMEVPGVVDIITYEDVPRVAHTTAGQGFPEPSPYDTFILDKKVRFVGDRVAAVIAANEKAAKEAMRVLDVQYEELEPVLDARKAMNEGAPVIHDEEEAHGDEEHAELRGALRPLQRLPTHRREAEPVRLRWILALERRGNGGLVGIIRLPGSSSPT